MNREERNKITSYDYADLFITDSNKLSSAIQCNGNITTNVVDDSLSVAYIPVCNITYNSLYKYGYEAMPKCFGLLSAPPCCHILSTSCLNASNVLTLREKPNFDLQGEGVLIGFVDTGIDYRNPVFQYDDKTTKIVSIWDQTIPSEDHFPQGLYYGTEFSREQINNALNSPNPLDIVPSTDEIGHGTALAGVTAGLPQPDYAFTGVAPKAEIIAVKLKTAKPYLKDFFKIPEESVCYQENDIIFGIQYLLQTAEKLNRPMVICLGIGTSQGSHAEVGILSSYLTRAARVPGVVIITAAGNEGNLGHHYFKESPSGDNLDFFELNIGGNVNGFSMELWCTAPNTVSVNIFSPSGEDIAHISAIPPQRNTLQVDYQNTQILIDSIIKGTVSGDQLVIFRFERPLPGVWGFRVEGRGTLPARYHVWLPMNNFLNQGTFFLKPENETTLTTPGNSDFAIVITAYNHINDTLFYNASNGFTANGFLKPDIAAPGINILSPVLDNEFARLTGTSLAAAHTAGIAAMILEWGVVRGNYPSMHTPEVGTLLIKGAKRSTDMSYPNKQWGFGILDAYNTYVTLINEYYAR
jgi:subtilisin family serine protease